MFEPVDSKVDFPEMERETLSWWKENNIMEKYLSRNDGSEDIFSFIDGPITANNPMGVHHAWGRTYKDLVQRYKTMKGFKQRYQNGFDCQGLWVEVEVEKELGLKSKRDIEALGIEKFVELCKARVIKYASIQTEQSIRLGYWMDWDNSYYTMSDENNYTIWHFLKVCNERGLIYAGTDVMPWCPRCGTGLSQQEVAEGYMDIVHPGLYVQFPILGQENEFLLVWTTTPWTLTSNTGVYVHPELTYVKVRIRHGEVFYLLKSRVSEIKMEYEVIEELKGNVLDGLRYTGPFDELEVQQGVDRRVVLWDEVNETEGTGIVHAAPGAGAEDFKISKKMNLEIIAPLDEFGVFMGGFGPFTGTSVFDVNEKIYNSLRQKGILYRLEDYEHRYPVCWRCSTQVVFRLVDEWYIAMDNLRDDIAKIAKKVRWIPEFGLQRELDWLNNMDDWMISKKRFWGLALPIYRCKCGHFEVIGSESELCEKAVEGWDEFAGHSPHRPWIDSVKIQCPKCGDRISRIVDVGNVWLDAGIVPFSTIGYRTDKEYWKEWFPAEWISESFPGQFRGWFYSLLVMSTVLENSEPFRTLHSYAVMSDEQGQEMHKSKGNAIWFEDGAEKMGVDAMRWLYSRQDPAANLNFGFGAADEVRRHFIIPMWNVYSFFVTYANLDQYQPGKDEPPVTERPELDRWILTELYDLTISMGRSLDEFEPDAAARKAEQFIEYLSNWYVRRSRRRFWKSDTDEDKVMAYATLYECLITLAKLLAPFMPFISEQIYRNLIGAKDDDCLSVHLEEYPISDQSDVDTQLAEATRLAMRISSLGRAARSKVSVKVRQPLSEAKVRLRSKEEEDLFKTVSNQISDEINVKHISILTDEEDVLKVEVMADMSKVGPKYGNQTPQVLDALSKADPASISLMKSVGSNISIEGFELNPDEVVVTNVSHEGYSVVSEGGYVVALDSELTPELESEGRAREMVHLIQNMRRSAGFDIADRIDIYYVADTHLVDVFSVHADHIKQETLSSNVFNSSPPDGIFVENHKINGFNATIGVSRI